MHYESTRSQKPVLSAIQALTKLLIFTHGNNLGLSGYLKSFKELRDVVKTQLGDCMLDHFAEQQPDYKRLTTAIEKEDYKKALFDEFMGVLFLINSDQRKYGSLCRELTGAFAHGCDEYPTTLRSAIDNMLDTHRFDPDFKKDRHESSDGDSKKDNRTATPQIQVLSRRMAMNLNKYSVTTDR
jgi:hypothetical protein